MFQKTVFESGKEFLDAVAEGKVPNTVKLVFANDFITVYLDGPGSGAFELSDDVTPTRMVQALALKAGTLAHIT